MKMRVSVLLPLLLAFCTLPLSLAEARVGEDGWTFVADDGAPAKTNPKDTKGGNNNQNNNNNAGGKKKKSSLEVFSTNATPPPRPRKAKVSGSSSSSSSFGLQMDSSSLDDDSSSSSSSSFSSSSSSSSFSSSSSGAGKSKGRSRGVASSASSNGTSKSMSRGYVSPVRNTTAGIKRGDDLLVPLYRYWNRELKDHLLTTDFSEFGAGTRGWRYQGRLGFVYKTAASSNHSASHAHFGSIPIYSYWSVRLGDHFYTTKWEELGRGRNGYEYQGIIGYVPPKHVDGSLPIYRYFHGGSSDHVYNIDYDQLGAGKWGWSYEGIAFYLFPHEHAVGKAVVDHKDGDLFDTGNVVVPLLRYYNVHQRDHLYTTNPDELKSGTHGWHFEGVQALVHPIKTADTTALYRYYNIETLDHFYTTNPNAIGTGSHLKGGWVYEGIQCYVSLHRKDGDGTVPLYRYFNTKIQDHILTTDKLALRNGWEYNGILAFVTPHTMSKIEHEVDDGKTEIELATGTELENKVVALHRYYHDEDKDTYLTTDFARLGTGKRGWTYDGVQAYVYAGHKMGTVPLYGYWNARTSDHVFTTEKLKDAAWKLQGIVGYVYAKDAASDGTVVPLYRYFNAEANDHFYTTNWKQLGTGTRGFAYQGVACYVIPNPQRVPVGPHESSAPAHIPLFRYYNPVEADHVYTTTPIKNVNGLRYQGVQAFCVKNAADGLAPMYGYYNPLAKDHYVTLKWDGRRSDQWVYIGIVCYTPSQQVPGSTPLYQYFSDRMHDHYYTTSFSELGDGKGGYKYQGITAYVYPPLVPIPTADSVGAVTAEPDSNVVPLRRYYDAARRDHIYMTRHAINPSLSAKGNVGYVYLRPVAGAVPLYGYVRSVSGTGPRSRDHFYTTNWSSLGNAGHDGWKFLGVACYIYKEKTKGTVPLYRYYSSVERDHMMTTSYIGREKHGFKLQGIAGYVLEEAPARELPWDGTQQNVPLSRYYNRALNDHMYVAHKEIAQSLVASGYDFQATAAFILKSNTRGAVPLYVYYNTRVNDHFYTTDFNRLGKGGKYGWKYIGIEGYVYNAPHAGTVPIFSYYNKASKDHFLTTNWAALGTAGKDGWKYLGILGYVPAHSGTRVVIPA